MKPGRLRTPRHSVLGTKLFAFESNLMNMSRRQQQVEREERRALQARREDSAGKLLAKIPNLVSLDLSIHEGSSNGAVGESHYIRRVVVGQAPALFELRCSNTHCEDGVYDLTREILSALASRQSRFEGKHACRGQCRTTECTRTLRYVATATYREPLSM